MATQTSRRNFLRGSFRERDDAVRPPGALERGFAAACTGCGDCAGACSEGIIRSGERGAPRLDFSLGACTFCGECAQACPTDALDLERLAAWPWIVAATPACLSAQGIYCRSCEDACDASAIRFRLAPGGRADPVVRESDCTGCGACISVCPAGALSIERATETEQAVTR